MIGIKKITTYIPIGRIDNMARAESLGSSAEQVSERIGFRQVARLALNESTLMMASTAVKKLLLEDEIEPATIELLVVVTQNPDRNIPHVSAELHGIFGLSDTCACFDISLGCSGYVYALSIVSAFMSANGLKIGILVTADPYSKVLDERDKNTALIFGDGATATLLTDNPLFELGLFSFGTRGSEVDSLACKDSILSMNGRSVFNFAAKLIPLEIRRIVEKNDLSFEDIDCIIVHQGSRFIVQTIAERLGLDMKMVPFMAANYGNMVSSSIPMLLAELLHQESNKLLVLCGFGLGFSWGSAVIKRR